MRTALYLSALILAAPAGAANPFLAVPQPRFRGFQVPVLAVGPAPSAGPIAEIRLPTLLDRNRRLTPLALESSCGSWNAGLGYDPGYRERFILFSCGRRLVARRLGHGDSLLRGIRVELEPGRAFRLRFHPRLPRLMADSFLSLEPLTGAEATQRVRLSDLLLRTHEAAALFSVEGRELGALYVTDIDSATGEPAGTRTVLLVERRGLRSTAWPIPESSLPAGLPVSARLGRLELTFVRTTDGTLFVYRPPPA
ncbi:MAG: hypothetical protein HY553_04525 [Elusimicrobia bacterium]|nr:hypothetical protein [Elusimicrobiota bacterium]